MQVRHATKFLQALASDEGEGGLPPGIARKFRQVVNLIAQAMDERDLRSMKSLRLEKLKGNREDQHSMRLNDQWRLVVRIEGQGTNKVVHILGIEDYH